MIPVDVKTADCELVVLDGNMALFTNLRLDRDTVPDGLYCYDVRESDRLDGAAVEVKPFVLVNHWGTLLCKEPFPLDECGSYYPKEDINYIGPMDLEEYRQASPEELRDEALPVYPEQSPAL